MGALFHGCEKLLVLGFERNIDACAQEVGGAFGALGEALDAVRNGKACRHRGRETAVEEHAEALKIHDPFFAEFGDALVHQRRIGPRSGETVAGAAGNLLDIPGDAAQVAQQLSWSEAPGPGSKAFDAYDKLNKAKEVLGDVDEVRTSIKALEAKVKAGEIRGDHGRMLKGTVILGKGLKLVVDKVPVVGWAGAEVVDKTFGVVVKVGSDFAKTTSTWDCCTNDPAADCCE